MSKNPCPLELSARALAIANQTMTECRDGISKKASLLADHLLQRRGETVLTGNRCEARVVQACVIVGSLELASDPLVICPGLSAGSGLYEGVDIGLVLDYFGQ